MEPLILSMYLEADQERIVRQFVDHHANEAIRQETGEVNIRHFACICVECGWLRLFAQTDNMMHDIGQMVRRLHAKNMEAFFSSLFEARDSAGEN